MELKLRSLSTRDEQNIARLLNLDTDSLYLEFGQQLGDLGLVDDIKIRGKQWIVDQKDKIYQTICVEGNYCSFMKVNKNVNSIALIIAIGDLLASVFSVIPVNTLAVLLTKDFLDDLCKCGDN